jgi:hypothetical protein
VYASGGRSRAFADAHPYCEVAAFPDGSGMNEPIAPVCLAEGGRDAGKLRVGLTASAAAAASASSTTIVPASLVTNAHVADRYGGGSVRALTRARVGAPRVRSGRCRPA